MCHAVRLNIEREWRTVKGLGPKIFMVPDGAICKLFLPIPSSFLLFLFFPFPYSVILRLSWLVENSNSNLVSNSPSRIS